MIEERLTQAKSKLMLEDPYFGTLVTSLNFKINREIPSIRTIADSFEYNNEYIEVLTDNEIKTLLANSAMHQALFHSQRGKGKIGSIWNLASDYAINELLVNNGFQLPPLANFSSRFEGQYAEQIYSILLSELDIDEDEIENQEQQQEKKEEASFSDKDYELLMEQVLEKMRLQGDLPKGLERFIELNHESQVNWRDELYRYVNAHAKTDYRMSPPNKKHLYRGIALPSIYGEELKIAVAIDTSASIDEKLLEQFLAELYGIMQIFPNYMIELIECDAKIQNIQRLTPLEPIETTLKGGGGTDFRPVFEHLEMLNEDFRFLIYFTDGMGSFPDYIPSIDILWVMPKNKEVPFGEVLLIEVDYY